MIRHVALFRFAPGFPAADLQEWTDGLLALPEKIDALRALSVGADRLHGERSWDAAVVADVESLAALPGYLQHPEHQAVVKISAPYLDQLAMVDFEI